MDTRYLFKRYNTWWVKLAVPKDLREQLGYDLRRSLKTHELKTAQDLRWEVVDQLRNKIDRAKGLEEEIKIVPKVEEFVPLQIPLTPSITIRLLIANTHAPPIRLYLNILDKFHKVTITRLIC